MNRCIALMTGVMGLCIFASAARGQPAGTPRAADDAPHSAAAPAGGAGRTLAAAREVARLGNMPITGLAVSKGGKIFVCAPRWYDGHTLDVAEVLPGGKVQPYPSALWNSWREGEVTDPGQRFVCVQSLVSDAKDRLWALDAASPRLKGPVLGGAKLLKMDPNFRRVEWIIRFNPIVAPEGAYLNDLRIDANREVAYITDSGLGAIIVTDLKTNKSRRLLADHPSTKAEEGVVPVVGGRTLMMPEGKPLVVHADGIALDRAGEYLYWQALCGRTLYRIRTGVLRDESATPEQVASAVENLGPTVVTDGMEIDAAGNIYFAAIEKNAIMVRRPSGALETLAQSDELAWPDSFAWGAAGTGTELFFTTSQIHLGPWFSEGGRMPATPYKVWKVNTAR